MEEAAVALPPGTFEDANYSECEVLPDETTTILIPWGKEEEEEMEMEMEDHHGNQNHGNVNEESILVLDTGERYRIHHVGGKSHGDSVLVSRTRSNPLDTGVLSNTAYWLRSTVHAAIYGRVLRGTVLQRLEDTTATTTATTIKQQQQQQLLRATLDKYGWTNVHWIATSISVAIKEISWDIVGEQRTKLAEDPIKEVAALQYLDAFVREQQQQQHQRQRRERQLMEHETYNKDDTTHDNECHVLLPLDLLSNEHHLYSITPYCNGGRLLDRLEHKGRFSEPEARYWMRQILQGLYCLKNAGIVHRDMSPENLMIHDDRVYIIDMGMCLRIPATTTTTSTSVDQDTTWSLDVVHQRSLILPQTPCGKWYYLSPEVCGSEHPFDGPTVDLWATGVILYVMLIGSPPWEVPQPTDTNFHLMTSGHMRRILVERACGLSVDAMDLLQRMLYYDPWDRLSLDQVWDHPWMRR